MLREVVAFCESHIDADIADVDIRAVRKVWSLECHAFGKVAELADQIRFDAGCRTSSGSATAAGGDAYVMAQRKLLRP